METFSSKNNYLAMPETVPIVPTMDVVVFPQMIVPLLVVDEKIINGINKSLSGNKMVLLLATKDKSNNLDEPVGTQDLYQVGTIGNIIRIVNMPDGTLKVLVQGSCKVKVKKINTDENILTAQIEQAILSKGSETELNYYIEKIKDLAEKMVATGQSFSHDFHIILSKMTDPDKIADFLLSHLTISQAEAQSLLELENYSDLLKQIYNLLDKEAEVAEIQDKIRNNTRESMNKSQKEFYLREQLKAIKKELGDDDCDDVDLMREKLSAISITDDSKQEINRQINRLERTAPDSMEATVLRNYIECVLDLPWNKETKDNLDIKHAKVILDSDHYGLKEIKERILDFISIKNLKNDGYAPIICFVGPPGTGKTSLGKSIAKCLGREYQRISMGGVKDEAEIRGHRRTYVGAMPGRFIQALNKAKTRNPLIVIDELDKIGQEFRGDPSAAMLEVLDPNQNNTFYDNYLNVPFDLSKIIFVATANNAESISAPLKDRMEIIKLAGYTQEEKLEIAKRHILSKALKETGLDDKKIVLSDELLKDLIEHYTREPGVRELERIIKKICAKIARHLVEQNKLIEINSKNIEDHLGPRKFIKDQISNIDKIGICNGLAWTSCGGEVLQVEAVVMPGKGQLILTGQLGDVMKESAQAALSYIRTHADRFKIDKKTFTEKDIHVHVPQGAVPKDGPSAGITILTSILSALTHRPINKNFAMTGEVNLQGEVMPIGGVKEKILAAKRYGIPCVILPEKNRSDYKECEDLKIDIEIVFVQSADQVLDKILG
jgi:ATP-dependent Lon protease